jgi:hypothetical protein
MQVVAVGECGGECGCGSGDIGGGGIGGAHVVVVF